MGVRLRWRFRVAPGVHLNVSKSGLSVSLGGAPATLNIGRRGLKGTVSAPGTGLSYSKDIPLAESRRKTTTPTISDISAQASAAEPGAAPGPPPPTSEGPGTFTTLIGFSLVLLLGLALWKVLTSAPRPEMAVPDAIAVVAPTSSPAPVDVPLPRPRPITH